jgi:hypothetical protein
MGVLRCIAMTGQGDVVVLVMQLLASSTELDWNEMSKTCFQALNVCIGTIICMSSSSTAGYRTQRLSWRCSKQEAYHLSRL